MSDATREIPNVTDRRLACLNYVKLFSNLSWRASFYGNWDNQPPAGLFRERLRQPLGAELDLWH